MIFAILELMFLVKEKEESRMKDFLFSHLSEIIVLIVGIINVLLTIFVRKVTVKDTVFEQAVLRLPDLINKAESMNVKGSEKKTFVLSAIIAFICQFTGKSEEDVHHLYYSRLDSIIESILSTPQKKEVVK